MTGWQNLCQKIGFRLATRPKMQVVIFRICPRPGWVGA